MKSFRTVITAMALLLPAVSLAAQGKAPTNPKMTPEARAAAQAQLNQQAAILAAKDLDGPKKELRSAVLIMRDSLDGAAATAALITRAQATRSTGVELSQARRLRRQCVAAQRTAAATLTRIAELKTPNPKGVKLLTDYRAAVTEAGRLMGECDKSLAAAFSAPAPLSAKIAVAVTQVNSANTRHRDALSDLMLGMEIPIRP